MPFIAIIAVVTRRAGERSVKLGTEILKTADFLGQNSVETEITLILP